MAPNSYQQSKLLNKYQARFSSIHYINHESIDAAVTVTPANLPSCPGPVTTLTVPATEHEPAFESLLFAFCGDPNATGVGRRNNNWPHRKWNVTLHPRS